MPLLVGAFLTASHAQEQKPAPTETEGAFVYVAPSFIKELDGKYPVQPPVPPSPPRYGGVLQFPTPAIRAFDPTVGYRPDLALVWDTLTEWEATWYYPEVQRTPVIRKTLVTDWTMKDPSTWIFKLRQGVKFHNRPPVNGREMVAEDVRYSYELLKDKAQYANRAAMVKSIQVIDKYTLRFELQTPDPKFYLNIVDSLSPVIVPREAVEAPGGLAENPVGTGAFMLKEFVPGEGALLVKNPDYYLKDKDGRPLPYVDAVRLLFTKDASTETALFRTKQLDLMRVSTLDLLYALIKTVPDLSLYRVPSLGWGDYGLSMHVPQAHIAQPGCRGKLGARGERTRSGNLAGIDRVADDHVQARLGRCRTVAGREALIQQLLGVPGRAQRVLLRRHEAQALQVRGVEEGEVGVGLDQPGHQRRAGAVQHLRSVGHDGGASRSDRLDAVAFDQDLTVEGRGTGAIQHGHILEEDLIHDRLPPSQYRDSRRSPRRRSGPSSG
jgi:hypothetical protein